jgi:hypothetical protein
MAIESVYATSRTEVASLWAAMLVLAAAAVTAESRQGTLDAGRAKAMQGASPR